MVYWECLQLRRAINAVPYKTSNLPKHYEICSYYLVIWFLSINFVDDSVYIGMPKVGHICKSKIFQLIRDIRRQNKQTNRKQQFTTHILFFFSSWIFSESWRRKRLRQMSCYSWAFSVTFFSTPPTAIRSFSDYGWKMHQTVNISININIQKQHDDMTRQDTAVTHVNSQQLSLPV